MSSFTLEIVTPVRVINQEKVGYVRCPGLDGNFGIMANHQEGIFALTVGEIKITRDGKDEYLSTGGGFAEIAGGNTKLLVESVEKASEIDEERAEKSLGRAYSRKEVKETEMNEARIEASLLRALNRLRVSKR
tara:strand:- start:174 stop:572 length:399 start_codon:yes stop_codon:yes gene_type:complete